MNPEKDMELLMPQYLCKVSLFFLNDNTFYCTDKKLIGKYVNKTQEGGK
jgi:hypothetical protein